MPARGSEDPCGGALTTAEKDGPGYPFVTAVCSGTTGSFVTPPDGVVPALWRAPGGGIGMPYCGVFTSHRVGRRRRGVDIASAGAPLPAATIQSQFAETIRRGDNSSGEERGQRSSEPTFQLNFRATRNSPTTQQQAVGSTRVAEYLTKCLAAAVPRRARGFKEKLTVGSAVRCNLSTGLMRHLAMPCFCTNLKLKILQNVG